MTSWLVRGPACLPCGIDRAAGEVAEFVTDVGELRGQPGRHPHSGLEVLVLIEEVLQPGHLLFVLDLHAEAGGRAAQWWSRVWELSEWAGDSSSGSSKTSAAESTSTEITTGPTSTDGPSVVS
ncbi:hypothetical protein [Streptomyces canus]|uniref:hypothetical protein n=1 Tax=Streptomyces canus TaxID=58343 RepID=UPI0027D7BF0D|nr:hypothetical protein [Streptomyces canus]